MKKVISYCLWGDQPKYNIGAIRNAELAAKIYPDWEPWYYYASDKETDISRAIKKANPLARIFYTPESIGGWHMMLDRAAPSLDPLVECFISRDADSRLSIREKLAVNEWLESDKGFSILHGHAWHTVPILGGLFGCKKIFFNGLYEEAQKWKNKTEARWQQDQDFLTNIVWPKIKNSVMNHADFHTNIWPGIPFPTPMEPGHFIGATYDENDKIDQYQLDHLYG